MSNPIKVMIVDDAFMIRVIMRNILDGDEEGRFKVVASAVNGDDAVQKALKQDIDVILMDIEMPKKTGLEALKEIMEQKPMPIIMFSSLTTKGAKETVEALSLGAVDFITKDKEAKSTDKKLKEELVEKILSATKTNTKVIKKNYENQGEIKKIENKVEKGEKLTNLIAIGCSTGGPSALLKILSMIPKDLKAGIVIVQHMPEGGYTASLAKHLNNICNFEVKEASEGEEIVDGKVLIAPGGYHLELLKRGNKYQSVLNRREYEVGHRPSVDMLYYSIARITNLLPTYAIIMTGMGSDGTNGCIELKKNNVTVITESEKTSVIYGMPKQVVNKGLSDYQEDLEKIIPRIEKLIKK